ncbi:sensor histidine kinase [Natronincola ferrireducens]|uniref:histidine kinase n=1 Tax=Natronincola ferrireducens TaxID=393762 RepID=A0A1G8ZJN5_9FIRM|nr:HAMP domain-containing sensor histidine kinase [Natronincola ferrireducens]SDK15233.1 His Kinase A (phospho-acceptor) domain-containing protein [Natronincola ferrireducens]
MFKKLKRKFVFLNMMMISFVMIASFAAIYMITFNNIQNQNKLKIENISSTTKHYMEIFEHSVMVNVQLPSGEYIQAFGVIINEQGDYVFDSSFGIISKEFILEAVNLATKENSKTGKILLDDKQFQYSFSQAFAKVNITDDSLKNLPVVEQLYQITFLDITESQQTLMQLLITFITIGVVTLFGILGISIYFAKRSVIPIEKSYIKQQQFIQDASHELKTPLASIGANLDAVTSNPKETVESQQKWLGYIYYEIERMSKLVNDLLYLAKTDNTEAPMELSPINFSETIENSILSIETVIFEKGIKFNRHIDSDVIVNGDEDKMEQIVKILLDNAVKYTNAGGSIDVLLWIRKNQAVFSVSNTGDGIAEEHIERIFDRFYRVDSSRKHNGSYGLGLSIAKSLVKSMNGEISVSSIQNENTMFTVKFNCV